MTLQDVCGFRLGLRCKNSSCYYWSFSNHAYLNGDEHWSSILNKVEKFKCFKVSITVRKRGNRESITNRMIRDQVKWRETTQEYCIIIKEKRKVLEKRCDAKNHGRIQILGIKYERGNRNESLTKDNVKVWYYQAT